MNRDAIKALLVDDDEDDFIITRDLLSEVEIQKIELVWVDTYEEALSLMSDDQFDVFLVDYRLGQHSGLDLIPQAIKQGCVAPIILLTGQGDHEVDLQAMKAGASDYLVKGQIDAMLLERSIRYAIERKRNELEKEKLIEKLQTALNTVKTLSGLLPICASCKKIRDDKGYWNRLEAYIEDHSDAEFTHGLCPECVRKYFPNIEIDSADSIK